MIEGLQTEYECIYCRDKLYIPEYITETGQLTSASLTIICDTCDSIYHLLSGIPTFKIRIVEIGIKDYIYFRLYPELTNSELVQWSSWSSGKPKYLATLTSSKFIGLTIEEIRTKVLKLMAFI